MNISLINTILNGLIFLKMRFVARSFWNSLVKKTLNPGHAQNEILNQILSDNKDTVFGKEHNFGQISSYTEFRNAVPVQSYEDLRIYIEKQENEKKPYVTKKQPIMYAQTSGTTGKPKYIPLLETSVLQYKKAQQAFSYGLYAAIPGIYGAKILAIRSPAVEGYLETGTPYGSMSGFVEKSMPKVVRVKMVVPQEVFEIEDYGLKYYLISVFALAENNVSFMATANPSTFLHLAKIIEKQAKKLIHDIKTGTISNLEKSDADQKKIITRGFVKNTKRAHELQNILSVTGGLTFADLWPNLKAVATWTGGSCSVLIPSLEKLIPPSTNIVEMGYLSSEFRGSITIDVLNNLCIPPVDENFFEFVEKERWENKKPAFLTLDQVEEGKQYYIFVTTQSGLYRYSINDIIEITGKYNNTPTIRFVQKGKGVTNITGEKLYENQLIQAVQAIKKDYDLDISFFIMLADRASLQYHLFLEHDPVEEIELLEDLEKRLFNLNIEFESKRKSGRLQPVELKFLKAGTGEAYKRQCIEDGQREGQYKVAHLQYKNECAFDFEPHTH